MFICGSGGSAGNAIHLTNNFLYGIAKEAGVGIKIHLLSANAVVITCLANDVGYDYIYSEQLALQGWAGDLLIVLSGSGNSSNIFCVLGQAKTIDVKSYAILGHTGRNCKTLVDVSIHFPINDIYLVEGLQLVVGHMLMKWLYQSRVEMQGGVS